MGKDTAPSQKILKKLLQYDVDNGCLRWNGNRDSIGIAKGDKAAIPGQDGYMHVNMFDRKYKEHVLIYKMCYGVIPPQIDHIDQDRTNNHLNNLRASTPAQNLANRGRWKDGFKGVYPAGPRYKALITVEGKTRHLGTYDTPEEAARAYDTAAAYHFNEFAGLNFPGDKQ